MNQLVDMPAGFIEVQVKHWRRVWAEVAVPDSHERQWIWKANVLYLDPHLGLHQFGVFVLAILDRRDAIHLYLEVTPDLHEGHLGAGVMNDDIVVEFQIPRFLIQMRAGTVGGSRRGSVPVFVLQAALDLRIREGHLLALEFHRAALDSA